MSQEFPVNVVLCWHMHQPQYQDQITQEFSLPWTFLHAIKDYIDMAAVIEDVPQARAVVNFTPVLLEQIEAYTQQFDAYFIDGIPFSETLLKGLSTHVISSDSNYRLDIAKQCIRANEKRLIQRFSAYRRLVYIAKEAVSQPFRLDYLNEQYFFDLLVWYHLVWLGETVRDKNPQIKYLLKKEQNYTFDDRKLLLEIMGGLVRQIIPRYRALAKNGQVELSFTPDKHPILPLLIDFNSARETISESPLPQENYPGGIERAEAHITKGLALFEHYFNMTPTGCWPSEGSLCETTLKLLGKHNIQWAASGGGVLDNSRKRAGNKSQCIHYPYTFDHANTACFFRDDNLSDLIGFTYSDWDATDAVNNLMHHIENIRQACECKQEIIVPIILDGENCWEHYPNNGYPFLTALYQKLSANPNIQLTTFTKYLEQHQERNHLSHLVPGSWVYGNFATWIGDPAKNRGWDLLCAAKKAYDDAIMAGSLDATQQALAEHQLAICEGSDWFWWFGDYNPAEAVKDFDELYRTHLRGLYKILGLPSPDNLDQIISVGSGAPESSGVMRRSKEN